MPSGLDVYSNKTDAEIKQKREKQSAFLVAKKITLPS
jgi:hypothetical protein